MKEALTVKEAAILLAITPQGVRKRIHRDPKFPKTIHQFGDQARYTIPTLPFLLYLQTDIKQLEDAAKQRVKMAHHRKASHTYLRGLTYGN